jgi:hypothetical protein
MSARSSLQNHSRTDKRQFPKPGEYRVELCSSIGILAKHFNEVAVGLTELNKNFMTQSDHGRKIDPGLSATGSLCANHHNRLDKVDWRYECPFGPHHGPALPHRINVP